MLEGSAQWSRNQLIENFGVNASFWHKLPTKEQAEKLTVTLLWKVIQAQPT